MSETPNTYPQALAPPTEARLSLRALLIVMTVIAMLAALVGNFVRDLKPDEKLRLGLAWGLWLALGLIWIGYLARKRFAAERAIGRVLLILPMFDEKVPSMGAGRSASNAVACALGALLALFFVTLEYLPTRSGGPPMWPGPSNVIMYLFGMVTLGKMAAILWWRKSIRFGEVGVLWDCTVLRWDQIVAHNLVDGVWPVLELKGISQKNVDCLLKIPVPDEQCETVRKLVAERITATISIPDLPTEVDVARVPLSKALRSPATLRYLGMVCLRLVVVAVVLHSIMKGVTGIREFDRAAFAGLLIPGLSAVFIQRGRSLQRLQGPPLVRLTGRMSWLPVAVAAAACVGFYQVGMNSGGLNDWFDFAAGFACGWAARIPFYSMAWKQFDLCANSVALRSLYNWPWADVRLVKWKRKTGKLVLGRGLRRIVSRVPTEQREAVEEMLRKKLVIELTPHGATSSTLAEPQAATFAPNNEAAASPIPAYIEP
ncbi:MAG: hypothetical protein IT425_10340 [Pirellulales bacterium]|nr:hypothetical protein [Pirellulales bacterium]